MSSVKYGVRVPRNVKEALAFDKSNGHELWKDVIIQEVSAIMGQKPFVYLERLYKKLKSKGFLFTSLCMIFNIKQDGHRKTRLVIGGHVLASDNMYTYSSVMKAITTWLLMVIAKANNYTVQTGDIKNAYLNVDCDIKICTRARPEFD